jgi:hypothetical protein
MKAPSATFRRTVNAAIGHSGNLQGKVVLIRPKPGNCLHGRVALGAVKEGHFDTNVKISCGRGRAPPSASFQCDETTAAARHLRSALPSG